MVDTVTPKEAALPSSAAALDQEPQNTDKDVLGATQNDPTLARKPRDARLFHMILAHYGCSGYQERVPLQLMDFAYRYTASILQDALHFTTENYGTNSGVAAVGPSKTSSGGGQGEASTLVGLSAVRLAIHSRTHYQYAPSLPKEVLMDVALEKNRIGLPPMQKEFGGMRLPPEQYLLTGQGWTLTEEFESVEDEVAESADTEMQGDDSHDEDADVEGGKMEDVFGSALESAE